MFSAWIRMMKDKMRGTHLYVRFQKSIPISTLLMSPVVSSDKDIFAEFRCDEMIYCISPNKYFSHVVELNTNRCIKIRVFWIVASLKFRRSEQTLWCLSKEIWLSLSETIWLSYVINLRLLHIFRVHDNKTCTKWKKIKVFLYNRNWIFSS